MLRSLIEENGVIFIVLLIEVFAPVAGEDVALDHHATSSFLGVVAAPSIKKFGKLVEV